MERLLNYDYDVMDINYDDVNKFVLHLRFGDCRLTISLLSVALFLDDLLVSIFTTSKVRNTTF